jgi:hypothetical protein
MHNIIFLINRKRLPMVDVFFGSKLNVMEILNTYFNAENTKFLSKNSLESTEFAKLN